MKKRKERNLINYSIIAFIVILIIVTLLNYTDLLNFKKKKIDNSYTNDLNYIKLPKNFQISVFANTFGGPRLMEFNREGILFVSLTKKGRVIALPDRNYDGIADETIISMDRLNAPHGLAFYEDFLYIAQEDKVIRVKDTNNDLIYEKDTIEVIVDNLPTGGHSTRTIKIFNESLYISIGSSCNICIEKDKRRAALMKCTLNGKSCNIFASGIRNAVGFTFHPKSNEIFATENARDWLGDDSPPDEINKINPNKNYGWPYCYSKNIPDPEYNIINICNDKEPSLIDLQAHSAPLGLTFYHGNQFPSQYQGKLFVAYHGSWNRKIPTGYKVVTVDIETKKVEDFATGWLSDDFRVLGRPVDVIVDEDGSLYVTDDKTGMIYKIVYKG